MADRTSEGNRPDRYVIRSNEELALVQSQLNHVELALASIRRDILPKSKERYVLWAEAYVHTINELRAQIDEYLGLPMEFPEDAETEEAVVMEASEVDTQRIS